MAQDDRPSIDPTRSQAALVHTRDLDDFNFAEGQPDPRGWSVKSTDGTELGKVEDLLVDTEQQRVRYIEVKASDDITKHGGRDYETSLRDYVRGRSVTSADTRQSAATGESERDLGFYNSPEYDDASFFSRGRTRQSPSFGDRIANTADDIKDRFDGNPASRPGPDATDTRR